MEWKYPTKFSDRWGSEVTTMYNDGATLSVVVRGVQFSGKDFDMLKPEPQRRNALLDKFTLNRGRLCGCTFDIEIETPVLARDKEQRGILAAHLQLGQPIHSGGIDRESLRLSLRVDGNAYSSDGMTGWFEDELLSLQRALPVGMALKTCFTCAYSDYSPYGHGLFGGMACFRSFKKEYSRVQSKDDLFPLLDKGDRVQETYLCADFDIRKPHTGYRG